MERALAHVQRRLAEGEDDDDLLFELCRVLRRSGQRPEWVEPSRVLAWIAAAWPRHPDARDPEDLFFQLLGLGPVEAAGDPAPWFATRRRVGNPGPTAYDRHTGMPLKARRLADDALVVLVPRSEGIRGTDQVADHASPVQTVRLDAFYINAAPVTVGDYGAYLVATGAEAPPGFSVLLGDPLAPLTRIAYREAAAYAAWVGGRIPSEAEFERAMRGTDGWAFPWGDLRFEDITDDSPPPSPLDLLDGFVRTALRNNPSRGDPVSRIVERGVNVGLDLLAQRTDGLRGERRRIEAPFVDLSPFGLIQVDSEVWCWCADWYLQRAYAGAQVENPRCWQRHDAWTSETDNGGPPESPAYAEGQRVIRQGSPPFAGGHYPCTKRNRAEANLRHDTVGFRVVTSAQRPGTEVPPSQGETPKPMRRKRS